MSIARKNIKDIWQKYGGKLDLLDINLIISAIIKKSKEFVFAHPEQELSNALEAKIVKYIQRRIKGEPLAYILGHKEFYSLDFKVNENVLVPRPETEMMVEEVIDFTTHNTKQTTIIDLGTGSGCIIITLAKLLNQKYKNKFFGIDISPKALRVAKQNAKIHKLDKQIKFLESDLLKKILKSKVLNPKSEIVITANLPYVSTDWENLLKSTETKGLKFEPRIALYAGEDGLDAYRDLTDQLKSLQKQTKQPITIFCEIGHKQAKGMKKIFSFADEIETKKDLSGLDRLIIISLNKKL